MKNDFFSLNLVQRRVNEEYLLVNQCIPYYCNTTCHPMTFPLTFEFDNRNKIITDNYQFIKWDWTVLNWSYFIFPHILALSPRVFRNPESILFRCRILTIGWLISDLIPKKSEKFLNEKSNDNSSDVCLFVFHSSKW